MAALVLDYRRLDPSAQDRVRRLLEHLPVHAEPSGEAALAGWGTLTVAGVLVGIVAWKLGLGLWATAIAVALLVRGVLGLWQSLRRGRLPWTPGRFLYPFGFVDARSWRLRILPNTDYTGYSIKSDASAAGEATLIKIVATFRDAAPETFAIFGTEHNLPRIKLAELTSEPHQLLAELPAAPPGRPGSSEAIVVRHGWLVSALAAVAVLAVGKLVIDPGRAADRQATRLRRYDDARAALPGTLRPEVAAAVDRLLVHARASDSPDVEVIVLSDTADWTRITTWLEEQARVTPGATGAAPVLIQHHGEDSFRGALQRLLPDSPLQFHTFSLEHPAPAGTPRLIVDVALEPRTVYVAQTGRLFAGLEATFTATLRIGDEPAIALGTPIVIAPQAELHVGRMVFEGDTPAPLGDADGIEDALIYTSQMSQASAAAAPQLAATLQR